MNNTKLIVPIAAQALVVYEDNSVSKLNLQSRFDKSSILGKDHQYDLSGLFKNSENTLDKGVHLHWKLPKILKHGITGKSDVVFPAAPNRWMVARYKTNINDLKNIPAKAWIIKSDVVNNTGLDNWVILETIHVKDNAAKDGSTIEEQKFSFKAIGKSEPLSEYREADKDTIELTGVGAANPNFSAIYDECQNVFAFHDKMEDANDDDTFSYAITGWYSDPKNDPLDPKNDPLEEENDQTGSKTSELIQLKRALIIKIRENWLGKAPSEKPNKTFFSHKLYHVEWNNRQNANVPAGDINICLGNNTIEAYCAFLKNKQKITHKLANLPLEEEKIEDYLNAVLNHLMEDEQEDLSLEKIKLENHKKQFVPKSGGVLWEVRKIEQNNDLENENNIPFFPNDNGLVENLKMLNKQQVALNEMTARLQTARQAYYFNWYKKVLSADNKKKTEQLQAVEVKLEEVIVELEKKWKPLKDSVKDCIDLIGTNTTVKITDCENKAAIYELVPINDSMYWQPTEPAVVMYGEGLGNIKEYSQDINDEITYRLSTQIIGEINTEGKIYKYENIFSLDGDLGNLFSHFDEDLKKLLNEAILLDPDLAVLMAIKVDGNQLNKDSLIIQKLTIEIKKAQELAQVGIESYARKIHKQAWEPLFMLWELSFIPKGKKEILCQGLSPMTNGLENTLKEIAPDVQYNQILSPNFSGFNKFLLAQQTSLQLPPLVYNASGDFRTDFMVDNSTLKTIGHQNDIYAVAPNPDQDEFSPIREGTMTILKLSLVDGFGRQSIIVSNKVSAEIILSKSMGGVSINANKTISLPKRNIQPTRVQFNWLNENGEVLYQDTGKIDHPILGWFVPNFLDNMLMVYNHEGHEVKALRVINDSTVEEFYPSAKNEFSGTEWQLNRELLLLPNVKEILNGIEKLTTIPTFIKNCKVLKKRISKVNDSVSSSAVSMLYGKPIAIAKAKISLEFLGQAINPQWEDKQTNRNSLEIDLKIGNNEQKNDGLLGYFIGNDYNTLYNSATSVIKLTPEQYSVEITVLLTAGTGFYITASDGILPTQYLKLFPHAEEELSKEINSSFMLCPFMSDKNQSYIPTPNTPDASWRWIHRSAINIWEQPNEVKNTKNQESFDFSGQQFYEGWIKMEAIKSTK